MNSKRRAGRRFAAAPWLGAFVVIIKSLSAGCNDLLWFWCRKLNAKVADKNGGQTAGNNIGTRTRSSRDYSASNQRLSELIKVIENGGENLKLVVALFGIGVATGKPIRHEISWWKSVNIGGVVMPERLRKFGVWI